MHTYNYNLHNTKIKVNEIDYSGQFAVLWEGQNLGFVFIGELCPITQQIVWHGNTDYLNLNAAEIGAYIEKRCLRRGWVFN
jgi:hypothetical protein